MTTTQSAHAGPATTSSNEMYRQDSRSTANGSSTFSTIRSALSRTLSPNRAEMGMARQPSFGSESPSFPPFKSHLSCCVGNCRTIGGPWDVQARRTRCDWAVEFGDISLATFLSLDPSFSAREYHCEPPSGRLSCSNTRDGHWIKGYLGLSG